MVGKKTKAQHSSSAKMAKSATLKPEIEDVEIAGSHAGNASLRYTAILVLIVLTAIGLRYCFLACPGCIGHSVASVKRTFVNAKNVYLSRLFRPGDHHPSALLGAGSQVVTSGVIDEASALKGSGDTVAGNVNPVYGEQERLPEGLVPDKTSGSLGVDIIASNKEVMRSISVFTDAMKKSNACLLGAHVLQVWRDRVESGSDFRLEVNLLKKSWPFVDELVPSFDYEPVRSKYYILSRLSALAGKCGRGGGQCAGASIAKKDEGVKCDSGKARCLFRTLRSYFGIRPVISGGNADFIMAITSYNISYKSLLLTLQSSGHLDDPDLFADIDRVLLVLSKIDTIEGRLLSECL